MCWIYVKNVLDEEYTQEPPPLLVLPKNSFPPQEFELREKLADWLLTAFVPFDSISWIDRIISKKKCEKAQDNLLQKDIELKSILYDFEHISALKRIISVMPEHVPQRKYLIDTYIETQ